MAIEQSPKFNDALHLVRGLCAMGVATYHYLNWEHGIKIESAGAFLVYVFFTLSALTMMMVHGRDFASAITFDVVTSFYRKRVARILPLLMGVAIFAALLGSISAGSLQLGTIARAYLTGTTLFGLQVPGFVSNVVAAWSLGIEAVFYLVFPIIALLVGNVRLRTLVVATVLLVGGQQAAILLIAGQEGSTFWFYYANPLVFAPFFALGILIYFRPIKERSANIWLALGSLAAIAGFSLVSSIDVYRNPIVYLGLTALTAITVLTAFSAKLPARFTSFAAFLGNISYALYLTHWFSYRGSGWLTDRLGLGAMQPFIFVALAVAAAYLIWRFFEVPTRNLIRAEGPKGAPTTQRRAVTP